MSDTTTPSAAERAALTDVERAILAEAFGGSRPSELLTSRVERIITAREAALLDALDRAEGAVARARGLADEWEGGEGREWIADCAHWLRAALGGATEEGGS